MSVFHRVEGLDQVPVSVFLPRMLRLPCYGGAVAHALRVEAEAPTPTPIPAPGVHEPAEPVRAHSLQRLAALNETREYGPLPGAGQAVGVFDTT